MKLNSSKFPKKFPKICQKFLRLSNSLHRTYRPKTLSGLFFYTMYLVWFDLVKSVFSAKTRYKSMLRKVLLRKFLQLFVLKDQIKKHVDFKFGICLLDPLSFQCLRPYVIHILAYFLDINHFDLEKI